jgi:hypothetical protein
MQGIRLEPAQSLLRNLSLSELRQLSKSVHRTIPPSRGKAALIDTITQHLSLDDIVERIPRLLARTPRAAGRSSARPVRLDRLPPLHGDAAVHVYSHGRPDVGHLLLEWKEQCLTLGLNNTPLFLENRWPVMVNTSGVLPYARLYAAFVRPRKIHPGAAAPPPKTSPYMLDEGEYQLRNSRLRLELKRSGPISFFVTFLRNCPPSAKPQYLFEPIA